MNHFIFVVCGSRKHTDSLNFSLKHLQRYTRADIHIITDSSRNESHIEHDTIIDVKTPGEYTNHEASIYLKTSLHRYLEMDPGDEYCYLDTDVVAVSDKTDEIFNKIPNPVLFARDHDNFASFSPYALNCQCLENFNEAVEKLTRELNTLSPDYKHENPYRQKEERQLMKAFDEMKAFPLKYGYRILRYLGLRFVWPGRYFRFAGNFRFDKKQLCWKNKDEQVISFDYPRLSRKIAKKQGSRKFQMPSDIPFSGKTIACNHLSEYISKTYGIDIPGNWRHWNGGVFRFNHNSIDFLETWHKLTIKEFENPYTKTRDQAMLAVSAWKFGKENMKTLPVKFNFITEYNNTSVAWDKEKGYTCNDFKSIIDPVFLHIYHHWGDKEWSIWQSVLKSENNGDSYTE